MGVEGWVEVCLFLFLHLSCNLNHLKTAINPSGEGSHRAAVMETRSLQEENQYPVWCAGEEHNIPQISVDMTY